MHYHPIWEVGEATLELFQAAETEVKHWSVNSDLLVMMLAWRGMRRPLTFH